MGRPSVFSQEQASAVLSLLREGKTLREACRGDDMPLESTVRGWVADDREGFAAQYAQAREIGYQSMADELLEIADDDAHDAITDPENGATRQNSEFIARSRLRVDTRKWLLSKALPKVYGEKIVTEHTGKDGGPIETKTDDVEAARRIAFFLASAANKQD